MLLTCFADCFTVGSLYVQWRILIHVCPHFWHNVMFVLAYNLHWIHYMCSFTTRGRYIARYVLWHTVRPSVRPSVTLVQYCITTSSIQYWTLVDAVLILTSQMLMILSNRGTAGKLVIMVALCNRADHYIFALWFLSIFFFYLSFFPRLISAVGDWMSTILWHMVWP